MNRAGQLSDFVEKKNGNLKPEGQEMAGVPLPELAGVIRAVV